MKKNDSDIKRIIRFIARLNIGGPAIHTVLLTRGLAPEYETTLVTGEIESSEGDMNYYAEKFSVSPVVVPKLFRSIHPLQDIKALIVFMKILWKNKPVLLHTHTAKAGFIGRAAGALINLVHSLPFGRNITGRKQRLVMVHTFHGHVFSGYFSRGKTRLFILIERFLALWTDRIIVLSRSQENDICLKYRITKKSKTVIIPLGFQLPDAKDIKKREGTFRKTLPEDCKSARLVALIGRLVPIKNHLFFIKAINQFYSDHPGEKGKIKWLIIGDGEMRSEIENLLDRLKLPDVHLPGWKKDLTDVYGDIDAVVLTSDNEGTPVALIEAINAGVPVLATCVGGVADILSDSTVTDNEIPVNGYILRERGVLIRPRDRRGFSNGIYKLLTEEPFPPPTRQKNSEWIKKNFSHTRLISDMKSLYRKLPRK